MTDKDLINDKDLNNIINNFTMGTKVIRKILEKSAPIVSDFSNILVSGIDPTRDINQNDNNIECIIDKINNYTKILIKLPGVLKENIKINIKNQIIYVEANIKLKRINWDHLDNVLYKKKFNLNETIIAENITHEFENCILYFTYKHNDKNEFDINI
tara:strand:+ start:18 stop:488 length:471 start_codon:yes stop_codon:yes gene_type:complete